jgi:molecular chaperone GrpE (heat shock protein)
MSDPRNVAHNKKVKQEKEHHEPGSGAKPKKSGGKKAAAMDQSATAESAPAVAKAEPTAGELEKSETVLSKLKEMEFHSRANIETLAGLTLTIEDELKQKEFSEPLGALYSAQDNFETKIAVLIEKYEAKCASLRPAS